MGNFNRPLSRMRSMSEPARKALALFSILVIALLIFEGWSRVTSDRLNSISGDAKQIAAGNENFSEETVKISSPVEGVMDSLDGLKELAPSGEAGGLGNLIENSRARARAGFEKARNFISQIFK